jgi:hypothetical protein
MMMDEIKLLAKRWIEVVEDELDIGVILTIDLDKHEVRRGELLDLATI